MSDNGLMPQACERCWTRKQKCDRLKPACRQCKSASTPCIERRLGTVLNPDDQEAHHSYIESLKKKVANLETQLNALSQGTSDSPYDGLESMQSTSSSLKPNVFPNFLLLDNQPSTTKPVSQSAMARAGDEQVSPIRTISFQTLVQAASNVSGGTIYQSNVQNEATTGSLGEFNRNILRQGFWRSTSDNKKAIERYFHILCSCIPFLSLSQLLEDYTTVEQHSSREDMEPLFVQSPRKMMRVFMAITTGMLMSKDYKYTESYATAHALSAYRVMPNVLAQSNDSEVARGLITMVIFALYSPFGGSAWHLLGLAATRCISADMHTSKASPPAASDFERKQNCQLFWALYFLDAVLGASLGRPFSIQDEDISAYVSTHSSVLNEDLDEYQLWNVQHAKLLHHVRSNPSKGSLFHFSNYRHWRDTAPRHLSTSIPENSVSFEKYHLPRSTCRGLLAILHTFDPERAGPWSTTILNGAHECFILYFEALVKQATNQDCAFTALDGIEVFSTAIGLIYVDTYRYKEMTDYAKWIIREVQKAMQLLTYISERFSGLQDLKDILERYSLVAAFRSTDSRMEMQGILERYSNIIPSSTLNIMYRTMRI